MATQIDPDASDFEKLQQAFATLGKLASIDDALEMFGLKDLPIAQRYGVFCGCIVFVLTVSAVMGLLVFGGSFQRIAEQAETGANTIPKAVEVRKGRPLLLERLLEARERMLAQYTKEPVTEGPTVLTKLLVNESPDLKKGEEIKRLIDEKEGKGEIDPDLEKKREDLRKYLPDGFEEEYVEAYRRCQGRPGGPALPGQPEARFEAYARAFAGCSIHTTPKYRRSYGRLYENVACATHASEEKFRKTWFDRPGDIVGRAVRLEPLEVDRHLQEFYNITCGEAYHDKKAYNPEDIWAFREVGPFQTLDELRNSPIFQLKQNEASFVLYDNVTDRMCGIVSLKNDDPTNLSIVLDVPIVKPTSDGTVEQVEGCFLLLDRLFALGYRRVQYTADSMDMDGKRLAGRLGFTQEGLIPKHMIIKESSRDSVIYGMLNSDWDKGARSALFRKLHGDKALNFDISNEKKEGQYDDQQRILKAMKAENEKK